MDYKRIYEELIEHRKMLPKLEGVYYERHHIVPRCMGGGDEDDNLIYLTYEDHFMSHMLLAKAYGGKLWFAAAAMKLPKKHGREIRHRRMFAVAKREAVKLATKDERRRWVRISDGKVFEISRTELRDMFGISLAESRSHVSGHQKTVKGFYIEGREIAHSFYDHSLHTFYRVCDGMVFKMTRKEMRDYLGLHPSLVNNIVTKKSNNVAGYARIDVPLEDALKRGHRPSPSSADEMVMKFINIESGDITVCTHQDAIKRLRLTHTDLYNLRTGRHEIARGFSLVSFELVPREKHIPDYITSRLLAV